MKDVFEDEYDLEDNGIEIKKHPDKVKIIITNFNFDGSRCKYADSVNNGDFFTSVNLEGGRIYGGCSPCNNEEEINRAVKGFKEWIIREGDIPIIEDLREVKREIQQTLFS